MTIRIYIPGISFDDNSVRTFSLQIASFVEKKNEVYITGLVDDQIIDQVYIALTVLKTRISLKIDRSIHVHFQDYSMDKKGSSAGLGIIVSLMGHFGIIKNNKKILASGELDLYGNILSVGGMELKYDYFLNEQYDLFLNPDISPYKIQHVDKLQDAMKGLQ